MDRVANGLWRGWPAVASAALYLLAFPPFNLGLITFVALVPWLCSLAPAEGRVPRGFRSGYLLGFLVVLGQMAFTKTLTERWTGSAVLGLAPWLVCAFLGAFYFAILGAMFQRAMARGWWWALPLAWAGMEIVRSFMPALAFPFFLLATPLWPFPMIIQHAFVGTIYFVSGWVVLVNVLFSMFLLRTPMRTARPYAITAIVILIASMLRYEQPIEGTKKLIVGGQPGVDMAFGDPQAQSRGLFNNVAYLYAVAKRRQADLLVLPEGLADGGELMPPRTPFIVDPEMPVIFGGRRTILRGAIPSGGKADVTTYQSAFTFDGKWQYGDKARLVVFGEYVPGRKFLPFLKSFNLPNGDLTPSDRTQSLTVGGMRVGPLICFESLFWDVAYKHVRDGAQVLAVMSNDDWFMNTGCPEQLRTGAVWRAIECDLPVIRAANLGYSMAVDQRGRVIQMAPLGKPQAVAATFSLPAYAPQMPLRPILVWMMGLSFPVLMVLLSRRRA